MLQLLQIMNYMVTKLEYTKDEVEQYFTAIENGDMSLETALDVLGLEQFKPSIMEMTKEKLPKWRSALHVTMMRME